MAKKKFSGRSCTICEAGEGFRVVECACFVRFGVARYDLISCKFFHASYVMSCGERCGSRVRVPTI